MSEQAAHRDNGVPREQREVPGSMLTKCPLRNKTVRVRDTCDGAKCPHLEGIGVLTYDEKAPMEAAFVVLCTYRRMLPVQELEE